MFKTIQKFKFDAYDEAKAKAEKEALVERKSGFDYKIKVQRYGNRKNSKGEYFLVKVLRKANNKEEK